MKISSYAHRILFSLLCAIGIQACDSANDTDDPYRDFFVKYYGGDGDQTGVDMVVAADGSIAIVGVSKVGSDQQIYFLRVDQLGNVLAEVLLGDANKNEMVKDIELADGSNFIIAADVQESANNKDVKLIKVGPSGNVLSETTDGTQGNELLSSVTKLSTGGYISCGTTDSTRTWGNQGDPNQDLGDFFAYRYNESLQMLPADQWDFSAGFNSSPTAKGFDAATKVFEKNGELYCMGYSSNTLLGGNPLGNLVFTYFSISADGRTGDVNVVGDSNDPVNKSNTTVVSSSVSSPTDPGFLVTGVSRTANSQDLFITKLRETLNFTNDDEIYMKISIEGAQRLSGVAVTSSVVTPDGYLILANDLRASGSNNIWISKMDRSRDIRWSASFGAEDGDDTAGAVAELPDGKILVLGTMELADNQTKIVLIKLNSQGQLLK